MENLIKIDDFGVQLFLETPIYGFPYNLFGNKQESLPSKNLIFRTSDSVFFLCEGSEQKKTDDWKFEFIYTEIMCNIF